MVHHGAALADEGGDPALTEAVASADLDSIPGRLGTMCVYARKLTRSPSRMQREDVEALRAAGLEDRDVVDLNQVVAYFNYVNRVADGLGVELEPDWPEHLRAHPGYGDSSPDR